MFKGRSAIEIMVITFTFLLAIVVLGASTTVCIVKILEPSSDVSTAVSSLTSIIASILSALLGLVAGKSDSLNAVRTRVGEDDETSVYERPPKKEGE